MTIDKEKLVELLVEKTSMSEAEIRTQLNQLIDRIIDAAKRGKALAIKEFGVFYFDEDGELRFEPSDELSTEISFKYAGMKPVELKPERDTSFSDDEPDFEEDPEFEDLRSSEVVDDPDSQAERRDSLEEDEVVEEEPPFDPDDDDEDATEEETEVDPFFLDTSDSDDTDEKVEPEAEPEPERKPKDESSTYRDLKPVSRKPVRKKDNSGIFILIAIVLIAVLIGSYLYYIGTQSQDSSLTPDPPSAQLEPGGNESALNPADETATTGNQQDTGESGMSEESIDENITNVEQEASEQSTDDGIDPTTTPNAAETDQPLYGLTGSVLEEANNGYSIVIHSFRSQENANETAEQLREDGYRVIVLTRTVTGNQVWRVSVGQFETLLDAQQATTRLPEPYNSQNFIQRIRIN